MTSFYYWGIHWGFVRTHTLNERRVRDPSGTDGLYIEFTLSLETTMAVISSGSKEFESNTSFPAIVGESPADTIARIRHMLLTERKPLLLQVGGRTLLQVGVQGQDSALDDANGPKPISCDVIEITGTQSFRIRYVVVVCLTDCGTSALSTGNAPNRSDWLSMRYTATHDIDEKGYSIVRYAGKLICRSSILAKGGPDALRGAVTPIPIPGYKRTSNYHLAADGLSLAFNIADREVYLCPPPGTVNAHGTHTVATSDYGGKWFIDVQLTLEGRKEMDKKKLMEMCTSIALDRLMRSTPMLKKGTASPLIQHASYSEETHGAGCTVHLRAMAQSVVSAATRKSWTAIVGQTAILGPVIGPLVGTINALKKLGDDGAADKVAPKLAAVFNFGGDPLYSDRRKPILLSFGERGYLPAFQMIAAAFQDPCLPVSEDTMENPTQKQWSQMNNPDAAVTKMSTGAGLDSSVKTVQQVALSAEGSMLYGAAESTFAAGAATTTVSIVDGSVDAFDYSAALLDEDEVTDGCWNFYQCQYGYYEDEGRVILAPTKAGVDVAFAKTNANVMIIEVAWVAEKLDTPPTIPEKTPTDPNLVLLDSYLGMGEVNYLGGDASTVKYLAKGVYRYGAKNAAKVNKQWPIPPWISLPQDQLKQLKFGDPFTGQLQSSSSQSSIVSGPNP